jgi:hypothetical protein
MISVQGEFISPIKRIISTNEADNNSMTVYRKSSKIGMNNLMPLSEDTNEDDKGQSSLFAVSSATKKSVIIGAHHPLSSNII